MRRSKNATNHCGQWRQTRKIEERKGGGWREGGKGGKIGRGEEGGQREGIEKKETTEEREKEKKIKNEKRLHSSNACNIPGPSVGRRLECRGQQHPQID